MSELVLFAWAAWAIACIGGLAVFVMRSSETGFSYVSLPRLLYALWLMVCVLVMAVLRRPYEGAACLAAAFALGVYALMGDETSLAKRRAELEERLAGCRRALDEEERNPASLELIGDVYSTLEDAPLALKYWEKSLAIVPQAKLLEKIEQAKRSPPRFYRWGTPCENELRACPSCETIASRVAYACRRCGERFFPDRASWTAVRFNRFYEELGLWQMLSTGVVFLPFLYLLAPWAYAVAWLFWIGARRPGPAQ